MINWIISNPKTAIAIEITEALLLVVLGYYTGSSLTSNQKYYEGYTDAQTVCLANAP